MTATFLPDTPPTSKRAISAIAVAAVAIIAILGAWAAGRASGYDSGRDAGRVEALRECGAGLDNGWLGNIASFTAPRGHRTVVCAVPDEVLAD